MEQPIISIKNLGKKYNINHQKGGYIALRDVLTGILKNPFRFAKDKAKAIAGMETKEEFWAVKDLNIEIGRGEIIGIIGGNGAGKSTLLKILSQITPPTTGEVTIRGRVGSLLEVGTGFHPELTGRENITLNGAILGMTHREIAQKFNAIVEFAGVEKFLDTPVKYYSSGMYVRLAFSVAAHMDPDILIIDEVLAVGDAEFQKKCLGKMEEVTRGTGRTIIFVSHNMQAIEQLCTKCILMRGGKIVKAGKTDEVVSHYINKERNLNAVTEYPLNNNSEAQITKISILDKAGIPSIQLPINEGFTVDVEYEIRSPLEDVMLCFLFSSDNELLLNSSDADKDGIMHPYKPGKYKTTIKIPPSLFNVGYYNLEVCFKRPFVEWIDRKEDIQFEIMNIDNPRSIVFRNQVYGKIALFLDYKTKHIK
jgi:lipopolysaccharide transport system ATP-binding protein